MSLRTRFCRPCFATKRRLAKLGNNGNLNRASALYSQCNAPTQQVCIYKTSHPRVGPSHLNPQKTCPTASNTSRCLYIRLSIKRSEPVLCPIQCSGHSSAYLHSSKENDVRLQKMRQTNTAVFVPFGAKGRGNPRAVLVDVRRCTNVTCCVPSSRCSIVSWPSELWGQRQGYSLPHSADLCCVELVNLKHTFNP